MKKNILLLNIMFIYVSSIAQTYREQFDKLNQLSLSEGKTSNLKGALGGSCSRFMDADILMYKTTNDVRYLDQFIILSKRIMDRRNDNWNNIYNEMTDLPLSSIYGGDCIALKSPNQVNSYAAWSRFNDNADDHTCSVFATFMDSGMITYPMAEFILLMQGHPELDFTPLPFEAMSNSVGITNSYNGASVLTFSDYALWLKQKVIQTLNYELNQNYYYYGDHYFHLPGNPDNGYTAINQQCQIARTCLLMYIVSINDGTYITDYRDVASRTATKVYEAWNDPAIGSIFSLSNGAPWHAWCHMPACAHGYWEDISHGWLEAEFIKLMVDNNAHIHTSNGYDFNNGYLDKIANGFLYVMCAFPASVTMNVYGNNSNCDQACQDGDPSIAPPPRHFYQSGHYVFLSEYNLGVYQAISDMYSPNQKIDGIQNLIFNDLDGNRGDVLLGLAQLCYYENLFNPITVKSNTGNQHISGAAKGQFNGVENEIALVNNDNSSTSKISVFSIDATTNVITNTSNYSFASGESFFMASGDLIPSLPGDEIATLDRTNNKIVILSKSGTMISPFSQLSFSHTQALEIASIGIGEFDATHNGKEIIINLQLGLGSPALFMYGFNSSTNLFENIPLTTNGIGVSPPFIFTVGDFNGDGKDDIAFCSSSIIEPVLKIYTITSSLQLANIAVATESNNTALYQSGYGYTNWDGITSGDFDADGVNEIMLHRARDGKFLIYRQVLSDIVYRDGEIFPVNQQNGIMCSTRLPNFPLSDALISFRSYDGQISIFNMDGFCPNLNLNNQNINNTTSLGSNYPIDYHVNGTLVAGNNFNVIAPSIVDMSSGKEIIFQPGFTSTVGSDLHAYIEPALECNPATFRRATAPSPEESTPLYTSRIGKEKAITHIGIAPNPNNGSFQISITRNEKPIAIKEIKVYDIMGKIIWENGPSASSVFSIDITAYAQGIYYVRCINEFDEIEMKKLIKQ